MTKEEAFDEYKDALKVALQKRWQYTYYYFKGMNRLNLKESDLNDIADTCTQAFFSRMQGDNFEDDIKYEELWK